MASTRASVLIALGTNAVLFLGASRLLPNDSSSSSTSTSTSVPLIVFSLLSALVSVVAIVTPRRLCNAVIQARRDRRVRDVQSLSHRATSAARAELANAMDDQWFDAKRPSGGRKSRFALDQIELAKQRVSIRSHVSTNSLYEQVKGTLKDHDFGRDHTSSDSSGIYLMNPATGCFLRVTPQRKLAFTSKPSPACQFQVVQSPTAQSLWSFCAVNTQRFIGQNIMQRLVAASKKVHAWETFQVLQRPDEPPASDKCSPPVYLLLGAARFGKGMWVADKTSTFSRFSQSKGAQLSKRASKSGECREDDPQSNRATTGSQRGILLSKQFDHAVGFVYSSDPAALLALAARAGPRPIVAIESESSSRTFSYKAPTSPRSVETLLQAKDGTFHVPMLARWDRGEVRLPWLDAAVPSVDIWGSERPQLFLETSEDRMSEIMTATIPGSTVSDFLEFVAPRPIRLKCNMDRSSLMKSGSLDAVVATAVLNGSGRGESKESCDLLCDWHAHPRYGMIRALGYRADASAVSNVHRPGTGNGKDATKSATPSNVKAAIVEQYHSCTVDNDYDLMDGNDEHVPHKAVLQTKMYTRGIPYSNCFSIEVLMEVEDVSLNEDDLARRARTVSDASTSCLPGKECTSGLRIRWRAGVVFSRRITLKAQIERGALNGVQSSCTSILKVLQKKSTKQRFASAAVRQSSLVSTDVFSKAKCADSASTLASSSNSCSSVTLSTREKRYAEQNLVLLPQAFALETIKGLISAIADTNLLSDKLSTLPAQLPWRPYIRGPSSVRPTPLHVLATTVTAIPFFESKPKEFVQVLEEDMGKKVTAALFFEALLSDALSYFRFAHADSGTMEVDISAWRAIVPPGQPYKRTNGYIRKQVFQMPLSEIPGVEVAHVEDFQYYALVKARNKDLKALVESRGNSNRSSDKHDSYIGSAEGIQGSGRRNSKYSPVQTDDAKTGGEAKYLSLRKERLEFGMKLFVPALPGGSQFSIEVLVVVEPASDDSFDSSLRVFFATPSQNGHLQSREHSGVNRCMVDGISQGLRYIWQHIAQTMIDVCKTDDDFNDQPYQDESCGYSAQGWTEHEMHLLQRLRTNVDLPTHDELASRLIVAIAASFGQAMDRNGHTVESVE